MKIAKAYPGIVALLAATLLLAGCGENTDQTDGPKPTLAPAYTLGGTLSGLASNESVVLQNNAGDDLSLSADGTFRFATALVDGADYAVTVKIQPASQSCTVSSGSGTVSGANVTDVSISCTATDPNTNTGTDTPTNYTVGGTLSGLNGTVVLQNNAGDDLSLTAMETLPLPRRSPMRRAMR